MVEPLRHRQTKGAATDMFYLRPPRHISTLPIASVWPPASHFRGRDASYLAPPAQIRASPIRAHGSHLGYVTARRDILTKFRMCSSACDTVPRYCATGAGAHTEFRENI